MPFTESRRRTSWETETAWGTRRTDEDAANNSVGCGVPWSGGKVPLDTSDDF